jgi:hypothetical protein
MFINKWVVVDTVNDKNRKEQAGLCLQLAGESAITTDLYKFLQKQTAERSFAVLMSGEGFDTGKKYDSYAEKVIGLFFQPCYYLVNYQPLLFITNKTAGFSGFLKSLAEKSAKQGLGNIHLLETKTSGQDDGNPGQFAYSINGEEKDYGPFVKNWLRQSVANRNPTEIHFLVSAENEMSAIFNKMKEKENDLKKTEEYILAEAFYQRQQLIDEYKHQLSLRINSEKDAQAYLRIQKEERASGLKWYHYEYEILPLWYKRVGQLIKVLMGKRSFKSLFSDNVKKYKD